MDTKTFKCSSYKGDKFEITVMESYPGPIDESVIIQELIIKHDLLKFLHNENGPAIRNLENEAEGFFLNGTLYDNEEYDKLTNKKESRNNHARKNEQPS